MRWKSDELDDVIDAINGTGFGLTLGVHSRIDATIEHIAKRAKVGNTYVNRNPDWRGGWGAAVWG